MTSTTHALGEPADTAAQLSPATARRHFYLRRLHSLSGIVPLGAFLVEHLWTNSKAIYGAESFHRAVRDIQELPALAYIEVFGIFLPLLFHGLYGFVIAAQARPNAVRYGFTRNWMYLLQRVSGVVAFAFVALHLWQFRVAKLLGHMPWEQFYDRLELTLGTPAMFTVYFAGITAVVFHFANGLWLFGNSWGITVSERSMKRSAAVCVGLGLALWALGINTLLHFSYACGGVIPMPEQHVETTCGNPDATPRP